MPTTKPAAVISSTARDLPEHRKQVMDACHRSTCDFVWMETLPASDDDAVKASMKLVDQADVYIGIFAHRYGYVPAGSEISITEMEYERAVARGIPRLLFFIHDDHPIVKAMVDTGPGAEKLEKFKKRIGERHVAAFFKSPEDLRGHVLHALPATLKNLQTPEAAAAIPSLHFVHPIPKPPEPYIAHYYALLQTGKIIGRRAELDLLTQWITRSANPMMHVIAIGGMGKSALTWHWFHHIAPQEWPKMKGRIWWSFYESDGHFENFVTRSLAYVSGQSEVEVRKQNLRDRCDSLIQILQREPYLIVLDGLERLLTAYARMDAPYLKDSDLDEKTQNSVLDAQGFPQGYYQAAVGRHSLRLAADPNVGRFVKVLCQLRDSRILTSSRLFPADLQFADGRAIGGCEVMFLQGLGESDALKLWREYGAKGSSGVILPIFRSFGFHPLVLKVFAGKVANYRQAPGDFDSWHRANPDFKPYGALVQVQSHILQHALRDLPATGLQTLNTIAGFRMAAGIDTLQAVLVSGEPAAPAPAKKSTSLQAIGKPGAPAAAKSVSNGSMALFDTLGELDAALTMLEDRGLLGWDRLSNRYDLHPIVRGVVWDLLEGRSRKTICQTLLSHFDAVQTKKPRINTLDELTFAIELYDKQISLGLYEDAYHVFRGILSDVMLNRFGAGQARLGLLEQLFPDGTDKPPRLGSGHDRSWVLNSLALNYQITGQPGKASLVFERAAELDRHTDDQAALAVVLANSSIAQRLAGKLRLAEFSARQGIVVCRQERTVLWETGNLQCFGPLHAARGDVRSGRLALKRTISVNEKRDHSQTQCLAETCLAEIGLWEHQSRKAQEHSTRAWHLARVDQHGADAIRAARLQGAAAAQCGEFSPAGERLHEALKRVRACDCVEEELPTLVTLAELHRRQNDPARAREYLDEVWDKCERGPYPLFHADAFNVLAQIERDAGHKPEAIAAATQAYKKAWCDGPPFAYHWGLEAAKKHLQELGAPFPDMPAFDESKYPPMPEVEINPQDDCYVEPEK